MTETTPNRVTEEQISERIASVEYFRLPESTVTLCHVILDNGYSVRGESACVDPANFDAEVGRNIALKDALEKLWPLFGFLLAEQRAKRFAPRTPRLGIEAVARAAYEVNRAYCEALGDTSQLPWEEAPQWQRESVEAGVRFHRENPDASPSASHDSWLEHKRREGWTYGLVKDPDAKTHPCMVEFEELPPEQRAKDHLFQAVVRALS